MECSKPIQLVYHMQLGTHDRASVYIRTMHVKASAYTMMKTVIPATTRRITANKERTIATTKRGVDKGASVADTVGAEEILYRLGGPNIIYTHALIDYRPGVEGFCRTPILTWTIHLYTCIHNIIVSSYTHSIESRTLMYP